MPGSIVGEDRGVLTSHGDIINAFANYIRKVFISDDGDHLSVMTNAVIILSPAIFVEEVVVLRMRLGWCYYTVLNIVSANVCDIKDASKSSMSTMLAVLIMYLPLL